MRQERRREDEPSRRAATRADIAGMLWNHSPDCMTPESEPGHATDHQPRDPSSAQSVVVDDIQNDEVPGWLRLTLADGRTARVWHHTGVSMRKRPPGQLRYDEAHDLLVEEILLPDHHAFQVHSVAREPQACRRPRRLTAVVYAAVAGWIATLFAAYQVVDGHPNGHAALFTGLLALGVPLAVLPLRIHHKESPGIPVWLRMAGLLYLGYFGLWVIQVLVGDAFSGGWAPEDGSCYNGSVGCP